MLSGIVAVAIMPAIDAAGQSRGRGPILARLAVAYQRCWYIAVSVMPDAGSRLVLLLLRSSWLYNG